ncbi:MAG: hypothetical protein ACRECH_08790 [Nitrososphaerales archaeon]
MRVALVSDIHGNIVALDAVLKSLEEYEDVDKLSAWRRSRDRTETLMPCAITISTSTLSTGRARKKGKKTT